MLELWFNPLDKETLDKLGKDGAQLIFNKNLIWPNNSSVFEEKKLISIIGEIENLDQLIYEIASMHSHFSQDILSLGRFKNSSSNFKIQAIKELLDSKNLTPVVFSSDSMSYEILKSLTQFSPTSKSVMVNKTIDFFEEQADIQNIRMSAHRFEFLGIQKHYCDLTMYNKWMSSSMNFIRLSQLRSDIQEAEVSIRDANYMEFNLNAIRSSELPKNQDSGLCGLTIEESCKIMYYAGLSPSIRALNISGIHDQQLDLSAQYKSIALLFWYYLEGRENSINTAFQDESTKKEYVVHLDYLDMPLTFYKRDDTDQWWLGMKGKGDQNERLFSCSRKDYYLASRNEISARILKILEED